MNKDAFSGCHPVVSIVYFGFVLAFSMIFTHPVCLALSLTCAFTYSVYLNGRKALRFSLLYMLPMLLLTAALNPIFNSAGGTVLTYKPDGNPLTLESILYGAAAAVMLVTVITWFSCFNAVITSDKLCCLFARFVPALSLIFAMSLRFVPRFKAQIKLISNAQKCIGWDISDGNILQKVKHGITILSVMVTWALESSVECADSMKCRGYGLPGRTAFSIYRFDRRDCFGLIFILSCAAFIIAGAMTGWLDFRYFPVISGVWDSPGAAGVFTVYFALCAFPIIVNVYEDLQWKRIG
jgi:energy-coupling factor transport system permease protein